jgi:hypothetical protein
MILRRMLGSTATAVALLIGSASVASACPAPTPNLASLRAHTTKFHSITEVIEHGYAKFSDINGISCIAMPGMGAMGVHYVNGALVGDPAIQVNHPEAMVYAPDRNGKLHLAAVEYIVVKSAWDATHTSPPKLFGHTFNFTDAPNRYGLPPFYSLHVWAFKANPAGTFEMWNPNVHCSCCGNGNCH